MLVTQQPVLRRFWYALFPMSAIEAGPKPFTLLGENIVVWKTADGTPAALRDRCCTAPRSSRKARSSKATSSAATTAGPTTAKARACASRSSRRAS